MVGVRRVTHAALKGVEKCQRARMRGDPPAMAGCNDPGQLSGSSSDRLQRAIATLEAVAGRRCSAASPPATLGYDPCPAPCESIATNTYAGVGSCLACVAQDRVRTLATTVFATPEPAGARTNESVCHTTLVRATRQYVEKRLRAQQLCQTALARGTVTGIDCRTVDYQSQIAVAAGELRARIADESACAPASLAALDLCPQLHDGTHVRDLTSAVDLLLACAESTANDEFSDIFARVYAPGGPSPLPSTAASSIASRWVESGGQSLDARNPRFRLVLTQSATVTVDLSSAGADAYLYLLDAQGADVLAEDDNSGGGTASRITLALAPGRYLLVAATVGDGASGSFSITTDRGGLKGCFLAYPNVDYTGSPALFCDGGTGESLTNDTYSSLRIPHGLFVRPYENSDRSGHARTYFGDARSLQPFLDNKASSLEWGAFDTADFFVVAVSDPQITWDHCADNPGSALCTQEQSFFGSASEQEIAFFYNTNLINALNTIKDSIGARAFGGVIVNGDLTEFGKQDLDLEDYIEMYDRRVNANVYPGLGNHDYANNVDDCFLNSCASGMVLYFANQVSSLNVGAFDYLLTATPQPGPPALRYDYVGSLAYSLDIGGVHFVQLNNYPTYTRVWRTLFPNTDHWFDIQSSINWLRDDLQAALDDGKPIIANLHDWGSADVGAFRDVLDDFPVAAVYAGHYHGSYGLYTQSGPYTDSSLVPVFLSGSVHYGTMLVTRFTAGKLYVWVLRVDHFNGAPLQVRQAGVFENVTDLSTLFDVCPTCPVTHEYVYDFR